MKCSKYAVAQPSLLHLRCIQRESQGTGLHLEHDMTMDEKMDKQSFRLYSLIGLAQAGCEEAKAQLFEMFQGLLHSTARKYARVSFEDALQEGCLAFLQAISLYDVSRGVPFAGYAAAKVRGDVRTAMRRLWHYEARIEFVHDSRDPNADRAGTGSRHDSSGRESSDGFADVELQLLLIQAKLSPRERLAITVTLRGYSSTEMGHTLGVSPETVKTWKKRALRKLRVALGVM